jgi:hypothetical protein
MDLNAEFDMDLNALLAFVPVRDLGYATAAITVCSALVAILPPPKNMKTGYGYVWRVIDIIALNFGQGTTTSKALATGAVAPVLPRPTVQTTFTPPAMPR